MLWPENYQMLPALEWIVFRQMFWSSWCGLCQPHNWWYVHWWPHLLHLQPWLCFCWRYHGNNEHHVWGLHRLDCYKYQLYRLVLEYSSTCTALMLKYSSTCIFLVLNIVVHVLLSHLNKAANLFSRPLWGCLSQGGLHSLSALSLLLVTAH